MSTSFVDATAADLLSACLGLRRRLSFPHNSHFCVSAALLASDGRVFEGTNYEGDTMPDVLCAERTAIINANMHGVRTFTDIAVIGEHEKFGGDAIVTPCGNCRQVLKEASDISQVDFNVTSGNGRGDQHFTKVLSQLLPHSFGPKDLGVDVRGLASSGVDNSVFDPALPLQKLAARAATSAYVPYTGRRTGAAIRYNGGRVAIGAAFENSAYGSSISALLAAKAMARLASGDPKIIIEDVAEVEI